MEAQIEALASHILERHEHRRQTSPDARLLVAIAGIPGPLALCPNASKLKTLHRVRQDDAG